MPDPVIAIDAQPLYAPQKTGHGQYVAFLLPELERQARAHGGAQLVTCQPTKPTSDLSTPQRAWWDQVLLPRQAKRQGATVLCTTAFSVPLLWRGTRVAIVHDLALLRFPQNMRGVSGWFLRRFVPMTFRQADRCIAISEATKRDLVELLGIAPSKILVVPSGVSPFYFPATTDEKQETLAKFNLTEGKYLLFVGTIEPRKNVAFLIRALSQILKEQHLPLVLVGKRGWQYTDVLETIASERLENLVRETGFVSEEEKRALYSGAALFCYASAYEGFGMPILEAMACGCPVVASNTSSLPEVVGSAGILLPLEETTWQNTVRTLLNSPKERAQLTKKGRARAAQFTWEKTAATIWQLLTELA